MKKYVGIKIVLIAFVLVQGCSKKTTPASSENTTNTEVNAEKKKPVPPIKTATPKVITVNDKAATKSVEGRYYYDLEGKRYWRNKKDGKYYLYYKGMFDKPEFQ